MSWRKNSPVNGNFDDCIIDFLQELQQNDESEEECGDELRTELWQFLPFVFYQITVSIFFV